MKNLVLILVFLLAGWMSAVAQSGKLLVKKGEKGLYLEHKVAAREGLYSVGRLYNVHPRFLAVYNNMDSEKGLDLGQVIRIPLTDSNFTQKDNNGTPVYHIVGTGDGLSKISNQFNKVSVRNLKEWNKLNSDNINLGSPLIVGYLHARGPVPQTVVKENRPVAVEETVKKENKPAVKEPAEKEEVITAAPKETEKTVEKVQEKTPERLPETQPVVKTEPAPAPRKEAEKIADSKPVVAAPVSADGTGFFKPYFEEQIRLHPASKNETVTAGIFKTTSGWQDAKYYLLIDNVPTGSIVRVVNPENNKTVYAKVLGQMNGIRQNQGLNIRVSSAAASALGVADTEKFIVNVNY
ncbi:MAG: LysM peptidoglycan-binding domain-containing protein [Chitinophagaceae bacterium]